MELGLVVQGFGAAFGNPGLVEGFGGLILEFGLTILGRPDAATTRPQGPGRIGTARDLRAARLRQL